MPSSTSLLVVYTASTRDHFLRPLLWTIRTPSTPPIIILSPGSYAQKTKLISFEYC